MKQTIWAVLILLGWAGPAKAWSEDGHRIVWATAWKELMPETRALVEGLLENDRASGFAEARVQARAIRSDPAYDWAKSHHDVNVPQGAAGIDLARDCPPERSCIIRASVLHIGTLRHPTALAADKVEALKFISSATCTSPCTSAAPRMVAAMPSGSASLAKRRACMKCGTAASLPAWAWTGGRWRTGFTPASSMPSASHGRDRTCMTGQKSLTGSVRSRARARFVSV